MDLDNVLIITGHCHPKWGLSQIDVIVTGNGLVRKGDDMPEPTPTPVAQATPPKQRYGYLHLRDLLNNQGIVSLSANDPLLPKIKRLAELGFCEGGKHNQWTQAKKAPATVAEVQILSKPEPTQRQTITGQCRVKRGDLPMVRIYDVVREWKPDHFLIKDPVVGGTFSRHIEEIEFVNISLQAVA